MKIDWKRKLSSRKFWVTAASMAVGILSIFGLPESMAAEVSGAIMVIGPAVIYIITEGKIDTQGVLHANQENYDDKSEDGKK